MNRPLGIGLIAAACLMAYFGLRASESLASEVSRFFTGSPTDRSVWLLLGAVACGVFGSMLLLRQRTAGA